MAAIDVHLLSRPLAGDTFVPFNAEDVAVRLGAGVQPNPILLCYFLRGQLVKGFQTTQEIAVQLGPIVSGLTGSWRRWDSDIASVNAAWGLLQLFDARMSNSDFFLYDEWLDNWGRTFTDVEIIGMLDIMQRAGHFIAPRSVGPNGESDGMTEQPIDAFIIGELARRLSRTGVSTAQILYSYHFGRPSPLATNINPFVLGTLVNVPLSKLFVIR